jgi:hypothetical protein
MSSTNSLSLIFDHPILTPILGEPTNASLQLLLKELYANTCSIYSTLGGGNNGHLAVIMPTVDYLIQMTNIPFTIPVHPGPSPVHANGATAFQITETNRLFKQNIDNHLLYTAIKAQLKQQIITTVEYTYLQLLEDPNFGFADVEPNALLVHLKTVYSLITSSGIKSNREALAAKWNQDDPIKDLCLRIRDCQQYAIRAAEPITDHAAINLTVKVFTKTGVFASALDKWDDILKANQTMAAFQRLFNKKKTNRALQN